MREFGGTKFLSAELGRRFPDCACEERSVGENSPGLVAPDEPVLRIVYFPGQLDEFAGEPTNEAFSDVFHRGMSVCRVRHIDPGSIDKIARGAIRKSEGRKRGYRVAIAGCGEIMGLRRFGKRLFCVYDTSTLKVRAHADVCCSLCGTGDEPAKSGRARLYNDLRETFAVRDLGELG